jgi:hypothetical protein
MSAGAIFQEVLRILNRQHLPAESQNDILSALEAGYPGPLAFLYDAGAEVELPRAMLLARAAAIYYGFCAVNLCDDLSDNECSYLAIPLQSGPCTQAILHHVFFTLLAEANLPPLLLAAANRDLIVAGGAQHIEMRTHQWRAPVLRTVAEGIAGRQWSAYLQILWHGTQLAGRAALLGMQIGLATFLWEDISSHDPRYATLPHGEKCEILDWGLSIVEALKQARLRCCATMLQTINTVLSQERVRLG